MKLYVLEGPASCANIFGYFKQDFVPEGRFALVYQGEFANGGHGPITVDGVLYRTRRGAEGVLALHEAESDE